MKISAIINQITFLKGVYYSIWFQENKPAFVFIVLPTISSLRVSTKKEPLSNNPWTNTGTVSLRSQSLCSSQIYCVTEVRRTPACSIRLRAISWATSDVPPTASTMVYTSYPSFNKSKAGKERHASVHSAQITNFFSPYA